MPVELALARLPPQPCHFLDLGTGTGAIALALAGERPDCSAIGVDVQPEAVALAQHNAHKLKIDNVRFLQGSWFAPVAGQRFALIASNPPYIDAADPHLSQGDVRFEPGSALVAADHGLADLAAIVRRRRTICSPVAGCCWNTAGSRARACARCCRPPDFPLSPPTVIMATTTA